jgi:hypothetical protein
VSTNINSAFRIRSVLEKIRKYPATAKVHYVWSELFSIERKDISLMNFAIAGRLSKLHQERELLN